LESTVISLETAEFRRFPEIREDEGGVVELESSNESDAQFARIMSEGDLSLFGCGGHRPKGGPATLGTHEFFTEVIFRSRLHDYNM
jgi:hypothetical protein